MHGKLHHSLVSSTMWETQKYRHISKTSLRSPLSMLNHEKWCCICSEWAQSSCRVPTRLYKHGPNEARLDVDVSISDIKLFYATHKQTHNPRSRRFRTASPLLSSNTWLWYTKLTELFEAEKLHWSINVPHSSSLKVNLCAGILVEFTTYYVHDDCLTDLLVPKWSYCWKTAFIETWVVACNGMLINEPDPIHQGWDVLLVNSHYLSMGRHIVVWGDCFIANIKLNYHERFLETGAPFAWSLTYRVRKRQCVCMTRRFGARDAYIKWSCIHPAAAQFPRHNHYLHTERPSNHSTFPRPTASTTANRNPNQSP